MLKESVSSFEYVNLRSVLRSVINKLSECYGASEQWARALSAEPSH